MKVFKMENLKSMIQGCVREIYSDATLARAFSKYSFGFNVAGVAYHCGYDPQESKLYIEGPATRAELLDLVEKVEAIFRESKLGVMTSTLVNFFACICGR